MCLTVSRQPSLSYTDADARGAWRSEDVAADRYAFKSELLQPVCTQEDVKNIKVNTSDALMSLDVPYLSISLNLELI